MGYLLSGTSLVLIISLVTIFFLIKIKRKIAKNNNFNKNTEFVLSTIK